MVEGFLAVSAPMEDRVLPGQCMQRAGDCCEILHITAVIPSKTQEGADFSGGFGRRNLPDGREESWIWKEALFRNPVPQITDLLGGEHDDVIEVEETRFPVETREDAIHEAGEGGGGITEAKRDLVKLVQLPTAGTKRRLILIPLHDRDLGLASIHSSGPEWRTSEPSVMRRGGRQSGAGDVRL